MCPVPPMGSKETRVYRSASPYPAGGASEPHVLSALLLSVSLSSYPQVALGRILICQELSAVKKVPLVLHLKAVADYMKLGGDEERIAVMKWDGCVCVLASGCFLKELQSS